MSDFERVKLFYEWGWATKEQVGLYVHYKVITQDEYKLIIGEDYEQ